MPARSGCRRAHGAFGVLRRSSPSIRERFRSTNAPVTSVCRRSSSRCVHEEPRRGRQRAGHATRSSPADTWPHRRRCTSIRTCRSCEGRVLAARARETHEEGGPGARVHRVDRRGGVAADEIVAQDEERVERQEGVERLRRNVRRSRRGQAGTTVLTTRRGCHGSGRKRAEIRRPAKSSYC